MRRSILLVPLLALSACAGASKGERPQPRPETEYRIGREDVLEIVVWREPELSRVMPVRPDVRIAMPLVGEMEVAGLTPGELQGKVKQALALAGGKGEFAGNDVVWLRQKSDGKQERVRLSYRELVEGDAEGALWLAAGDVLYVP